MTAWFVTVGSLVAMLLVLVTNLEKVEQFTTFVLRALGGVVMFGAKARNWYDRKLTKATIQAVLNVSSERINREYGASLLPCAARVKWVKAQDVASVLAEGEVVVRLSALDDSDDSLASATLLYLEKGFIPHSRRCLDASLRRACEFWMAFRILGASAQRVGAINRLNEDYFEPEALESAALKPDLAMVQRIELTGMFGHLFLPELSELGRALAGNDDLLAIQPESRELAQFLDTIARKAAAEDVPLEFWGQHYRVSVLLLAREETAAHGTTPYLWRIREQIRKGYETLYLCAIGAENIDLMGQVIGLARGKELLPAGSGRFSVHGTPGRIIRTLPNQIYLERNERTRRQLVEALGASIDEVSRGEIQVADAAFSQWNDARFVARRANGGTTREIIADVAQLASVRETLTLRELGVVDWTDDLGVLALRALGLNDDVASEVSIDHAASTIDVLLHGIDVATQWALDDSSGGQLAEDLLGYQLVLHRGPASDPEVVELLDALLSVVPELESGEIAVRAAARIPGHGSRIVVDWAAPGRADSVVDRCRGENGARQSAIRERLGNEVLFFHEWHDDPALLVKRILYPMVKTGESYSDCRSAWPSVLVYGLADLHGPWLELSERTLGRQVIAVVPERAQDALIAG